MPKGIPRNGKRRGRRRSKLEGVTYFGPEAKLVLTADKTVGKLKVVDLGDRWAILATG